MLLSSLISLNAPPNLTHGSLIPSMPSDPLFVVLKTSINALSLLFPFHPLSLSATAITNSSFHAKSSIILALSLLDNPRRLWQTVNKLLLLTFLCCIIAYYGCTLVALCPVHAIQVASSVFTALHVMQTRYSDENSVRLSVRPSVRLSVCHTRVL